MNEATPPNHINSNAPRCSSQGDRIAAIFDFYLSIFTKPKTGYNSFKSLVLSLSHSICRSGQPVLFTVLYCPSVPYFNFLSNFLEILSSLVIKLDKVINIDSFNIRVDVTNENFATAFNSLLESISFCQCVHKPTHYFNHTLDLVLA